MNDRSSAITAINKWNQRNGRARRIFFSPLTWEDLVAPDIGGRAQDVINQQIGLDYDIFLGIMWSRFGAPTGEADSGTEEEFNQAVKRYHKDEPITISFLFKNSSIPQSILDGIQFSKVQSFKKIVSDAGCLYREFSDDTSFYDALNLILDRSANQYEVDLTRGSGPPVSPDASLKIKSAEPLVEFDQESDLGLFDYLEEMSKSANEFALLMGGWTDKLVSVGSVTENATSELNNLSRFGNPDNTAAKKIIDRIGNHIGEVADWGEENEVSINESMENISSALSGVISLSSGFSGARVDKVDVINSADSLLLIIDETNQALNSLLSVMSSMPRLSKLMNKAIRRLKLIIENMIIKNETFKNNIKISIDEVRKEL